MKAKPIPETVRSQLLKIAALAERGVDGERETARRMLRALLHRHGLREADVTAPVIISVSIPISAAWQVGLACQCWAFVTDHVGQISYHAVYAKPKARVPTQIELPCTPVQAIDFRACFYYYRPLLASEFARLAKARRALTAQWKILHHAFYNKHEIFPASASKDGGAASVTDAMRRAYNSLANHASWQKPAGQLETGLFALCG